MADPVVELIVADIETKIALITTGGGFEYTLTVARTKPGLGNPADGQVIIQLGEAEEGNPPQQRTTWHHNFRLIIYAIGDSTDQWMTKALRMAADVSKKLMEDHTRDSNAIDTFVGVPSAAIDEENALSAVIVPVKVHYRYDVTDPYSQT